MSVLVYATTILFRFTQHNFTASLDYLWHNKKPYFKQCFKRTDEYLLEQYSQKQAILSAMSSKKLGITFSFRKV